MPNSARILIIDDDPLVGEAISALLARHGYNVDCAHNGRDALESFDSAYDLVVTDIIMPEVDGIETIRELRRRRPALKIVAISGGARLTPGYLLDTAQKFGADATFTKPLDNADFIRTIGALLAG